MQPKSSPFAAHRVALTLAAAAVAALALCGPASAHETVTTVAPGSTMSIGGGDSQGLSLPLVLTAVALVPLTGAFAMSVARRRKGRRGMPSPAHVAAVALAFTGIAHVAATPEHWAEGWHLGLFFAASGLLLIGQGAAIWKRPTSAAYGSIIVSTTALIVLYFVARETVLPFVDHRDPYLFEELPVKVAEGIAAALSVAALVPLRARRMIRPRRQAMVPLTVSGA